VCRQVPAEQLIIDNTPLPCVNKVRDLGVYLDSDMLMVSHITQSARFAKLRQIHSVRRSLTIIALSSLITSLIMTKVNYCNIPLAGVPQPDLQGLQTVINAVACLAASTH